MKSLLITGGCPYNLYQERALQDAGVDARYLRKWGMHLPDCVEEIVSLKPDIIHFQWPEAMTRHQELSDQAILSDFSDALPRLKSSGARIFWAMHNLLPHDRNRVEMWRELYGLFARYCDVCCHHSACGKAKVLETYDFPTAKHVILRHGYFDRDVAPQIGPKEARQRLGLPESARIFCSISSIRPDKYVEELITCFRQRDPGKDILLLAGLAGTDYGKRMIQLADETPNVHLTPGFIDDGLASLMANASDQFIFMHGEHHLTSGAPHLSQAHLLPQITLDYVYAREVMAEAAIYISPGSKRFEALQDCIDRSDPDESASHRKLLEERRSPWSWSLIGRETLKVYEEALAS